MAFASAGLPPPVLNAAAAEGAARGRDGAQEADDGQRLGVKRRLDGELASARVNDDDAKEGDTIMVDAAQMAAAAAAGTDRLRLRSEGPATRRLGVNGHPRVASNQTGCE